ncbi:uncharacterized protein MELLADRAFT_65131 [Melampsora larici-populina 98AG31]|uniref:Uncharacterized protein n=1 Tax=Melampsora larici-populina (strain 98AG31 / pathotype 3-4-7) TaxID=747676 RepID=F4RU35_MELLP|nr:uncharacterized protein MELLADRAFT_65131 [Melampsora larici-populina 98AG31]EGG04106.1 hypothetical protein MELLADRAFT_65131 [Melampsora larici-populina 98AG31]
MPPRSAYRLAVCRCVTYGCGQQQYIDADGNHQTGNRINHTGVKAHQLADQLQNLSMTSENQPARMLGHIPVDELAHRPLRPSADRAFSQPRDVPESSTRATSNGFSAEAGPSNRPFHANPTQNSQKDAFDTSPYLEDEMYSIDPVLLYPILFTASLALFSNLSVRTTNWALKSQRGFVKLIKESGSTPAQARTDLLYTEQKELEEIPSNIHTVFSKLNLNPRLTVLNTCPSCFAMFPVDHAPEVCNFPINTVPGLFKFAFLPPSLETSDAHMAPNSTSCSQPLFKKHRPIRQTGFQDLEAWIARFICRPNIEEMLDRSLKESNQPFWAMQDDEVDEPEPRPPAVPEIRDLLCDLANEDFNEHSNPPSESDDPSSSTHPSAPRVRIANLACSTGNSSTDPDYENQGWAGELEITFIKTFCRAGNLSSLLRDARLPEAILPYRSQLLSIIDPEPFVAQTFPQPDRRSPIEVEVFQQLVHRLNSQKVNNRRWIPSTEWCLLSKEGAASYSPVASSAIFVPRITREGVIYSTVSDNPGNSVVQTQQGGTTSFGQILSIFHHRRIPVVEGPPISDTWISIREFPPIPMSQPNPFRTLAKPDMQTYLRLDISRPPSLIHIDEIVAHCGWMTYEPEEVTDQLKLKTIALVSLDR